MHIGQVESTYLLAARDWNQVDVPAHCSSLGKVLYAYDCLPLPTTELEQRTDHTVGRDTLVAQLPDIRRRRYAGTSRRVHPGRVPG